MGTRRSTQEDPPSSKDGDAKKGDAEENREEEDRKKKAAKMSWRAEWTAISDRIGGILKTGEFYIRCSGINNQDPPRLADKILIPRAAEVVELVHQYRVRYANELPKAPTIARISS